MDDLQFDKAEYYNAAGIGPCVSCGAPIEDVYWKRDGHVICPQCGTKAEQAQMVPQKSELLRGALYAFGMAILCALGYAIIIVVTKYELAIIAIAVGWLIGSAARKGTNGLGGRRLQYVAVAATYLAICGSLFFQILWEYKEKLNPFSIVFLFIVSLGKPVIEIADGFGGVLGLIILFFGLQQAWKQTGNLKATVEGPLRVEAGAQS